jgi:hypothetical protein
MKRVQSFLIACLLLSPLPASAWDSATHTALIQLTRPIINIPGFWESEHTIVLDDDAGKRCYEDRTKKLAKFPQRRVFLELVCGADEPDHERRFKPWLNHAHQTKAEKFAVDEFNAAVNAYGQRGSKGDLAYAEAANHLGRSIHFLQDLTDFSKDMGDRSDARKVRKQSIKIAQAYLEDFQKNRRYPNRLATRLNTMHAALRDDYQTPGQLVAGALQERAEMADTVSKFLSDPEETGSWDSKLNEALVATLAGTIVLQEFWVEQYLKQIGVMR